MKFYQDYVGYFKNLAVQHTSVGHVSGETERFFTINLEEILTGLRSKIDSSGCFVVLTNYIWRPVPEAGGTVRKHIEGMFYVLHRISEKDDDTASEVEKMELCERVATDFINRISLDSKKEGYGANTFFGGSQNTLNFENCTPAELDASNKGYQVIFSIEPNYNTCVDHTVWNDLATEADAKADNY